MSRNYTKHYLEHGDDDFNIYEGEPEEKEVTTHQNAHFANGGEGFWGGGFDDEYLEAIIEDAVEMHFREIDREEQKKQALKHSEDLDKEMTEEDYQRFIHEQLREQHRYKWFQLVLDEFKHYVPDMLAARMQFQVHQGIPMSGKLMDLEKKQLFYF